MVLCWVPSPGDGYKQARPLARSLLGSRGRKSLSPSWPGCSQFLPTVSWAHSL